MSRLHKPILIVTNKQDYTADYVIIKLKEKDFDFVRFNTEEFPERVFLTWGADRLAQQTYGTLTTGKRCLQLSEIMSVWFRRPLSPVPSARIIDSNARRLASEESLAAIEGLWTLLDCHWVSRPDSLRNAENKPLQLKIASQMGFTVPSTLISNQPDEFLRFYENHSNDVVIKPLRCGSLDDGEKVKLIYTNIIERQKLDDVDLISLAPCLFQERIQKESDIRVTIFGEKLFAFEIKSQDYHSTELDWRRESKLPLRYVPHELPKTVYDLCIKLVKNLGLTFGAIDLARVGTDKYVFFEINPNGQWAWIEQITGVDLSKALIDLLVGDRN
jgi:glutathione synthase/RimK-type ligase-like ATP-grasp enzyme